MKHIHAFVAVLVLAGFFFVIPFNAYAAGECPVKAEVRAIPWQGRMTMTVATIQATADTVTLVKVTVNRGNTEVYPRSGNLPAQLKFGQKFDFGLTGGVKDVLEIHVETDKGDWTLSFN